MIQGRGMVTPRIRKKSKELLGYEIGTAELRLLPYVQYVMCNSQKLDPVSINRTDRKIIDKWRSKKWISGGTAGLKVTKAFWDKMCELIYLSYVDIQK